jgi:hypothetical protein
MNRKKDLLLLAEQYTRVYEDTNEPVKPHPELPSEGPGGNLELIQQPDGTWVHPDAPKDENGEYIKNADGTGSVKGPGTPFGQPGNNPIPKTKLTPQEETIIKQNYGEMINAVKSGDLQKAYQVLKNIERLINASQPQQVNSER